MQEEKVRLAEAYEEFRETFEEGAVKISKTFIRGDVVNANKSSTDIFVRTQIFSIKLFQVPNTGPALYKPAPVIQIKSHKHGDSVEAAKKIAEQAAKKIMSSGHHHKAEEHHAKQDPNLPTNRPPKPGTKKVETKQTRLSNLEAFKEELKLFVIFLS